MTTPRDNREYVTDSVAGVFDLVHLLVTLWFWVLGLIAVGCILFVVGSGVVAHPVTAALVIGGLVVGWEALLRRTRRRQAAVAAKHAAKQASYRQWRAERAEKYPDIVFEENRRDWEREHAA